MTQAITDKTHILALRDNVKIWINQNEFEAIKAALSGDKWMFEIQGRIIMKNAVLYIISAADQVEAEKIKRGYWRCSSGNLHSPEFKECSC
jgi:hypothetical protein